MPLIEGVGDEVTEFFVALIIVLVVYIAWRTTSISEQRHLRTVFLIDRQSRIQRTLRRNNQAHTMTSEATSTAPQAPAEDLPSETAAPQSTLRKPPEAGSSIDDQTTATSPEEQEQNTILRTMDAETNILRQRRTAFYNRHDTLLDRGEPAASSESSEEESQYEGVPDGEGEFVLTEQNYACLIQSENNNNVEVSQENDGAGSASNENGDSVIKIKLKYINDDLKLVEGRLQETVGEFKRRHFDVELNSNKIVRLIFNGRVLQTDNSSLQHCGLFDNCVVHCLIHNKRPSLADSNNSTANSDDFIRRSHRQRLPQMNNNNQGRESDLGNVLFALISFILGSAWYFRYVYAHLYTITATVALVAVTGIFSVVVIGMYFPDQEAVQQRRDNEQR